MTSQEAYFPPPPKLTYDLAKQVSSSNDQASAIA